MGVPPAAVVYVSLGVLVVGTKAYTFPPTRGAPVDVAKKFLPLGSWIATVFSYVVANQASLVQIIFPPMPALVASVSDTFCAHFHDKFPATVTIKNPSMRNHDSEIDDVPTAIVAAAKSTNEVSIPLVAVTDPPVRAS